MQTLFFRFCVSENRYRSDRFLQVRHVFLFFFLSSKITLNRIIFSSVFLRLMCGFRLFSYPDWMILRIILRLISEYRRFSLFFLFFILSDNINFFLLYIPALISGRGLPQSKNFYLCFFRTALSFSHYWKMKLKTHSETFY